MHRWILSLGLSLAVVTAGVNPGLARDDDRHDGAVAAAVVGGLLIGAAALAASSNDHQHEHHYKPPPPRPSYAPFSPTSHITCYPAQRACYQNNGRYNVNWTQRIYGR